MKPSSNLELAAEPPPRPQRSPLRQPLADAIVARGAAEQALEAARRAVVRGADVVAKAERQLEVAREGVAGARVSRARALADAAADAAMPAATNMTRAARVAEGEAEDEVEAARAALAGLKANVARAEAELRHSQNMVVAHADRVLRGAAAKGVMADAVDLTVRLRRARLTLHLLMRPEMAGRVIAVGRQPDIFGKAGDREAEQVRSDGFGGEVEAAIQRHLEFGLGSIHEAERQWSLAPELAPWVEARIALMDDPDAPLPPI
jgi:hypothetical protein